VKNAERSEQVGTKERLKVVPHETREQAHRLGRLLRSGALAGGEIGSVLAELTELGLTLTGVRRATVWQLTLDGESLECLDLCTAREPARHERGQSLSASSYPGFLSALNEERVLAVSDVHQDPRTCELAQDYFAACEIDAVLCAPVFVRGRLIGAVCLEHVGRARVWSASEELLAASFADCVSLVVQAREMVRTEYVLNETRSRVEELLEQRTSSVVRENADLQREVDALTETTEAIRRSEDDLRLLFAASPVPMLLIQRSASTVMFANEKSAVALSRSVDELANSAWRQLFAHHSDYRDLRAQVERNGQLESVEVELVANGHPFWALVSARTVTFDDQNALMFGFTDLTAQKAVEHQLRSLAQRDPLTQAFNRHHFWHLANQEMTRVARYNRPLALAMLDADLFKNINDRHGHDVGDRALRMIADTCQEAMRKSDVLARYGGEELVMLLPETTAENAAIVMERIREKIAATPLALEHGKTVSITVSIGVAGVRHAKESLDSVLKCADEALYAAKRSGRNRVQVSAPA
jgi:diguanylate cyclase (GGDEF)-like protein